MNPQINYQSSIRSRRNVDLSALRSSYNSSQQESIGKQKIKHNKLSHFNSQLEELLIDLRGSDNKLQYIADQILTSRNFAQNQQSIQEKSILLGKTVQKYFRNQSQSELQKQLTIEGSILQIQSQIAQKASLNIQGEKNLQIQRVQQSIINKICDSYSRSLQQIQQNLNNIKQELHKRKRSPEFQSKISILIDQLKSRIQNNLSQNDILLIKNLDFNSLTCASNQQIKQKKRYAAILRQEIEILRMKSYNLKLTMKKRTELEKRLSYQEEQNIQLNQRVKQITYKADHLENNFQHEVQNVVNQKIQDMNYQNFKYISKYIIASQFLLGKFGHILSNEQLQNFRDAVSHINIQSQIKIQQRS